MFLSLLDSKEFKSKLNFGQFKPCLKLLEDFKGATNV